MRIYAFCSALAVLLLIGAARLPRDFMPHGACWRWDPWLVGIQLLSNVAIGVSYLVIAGVILIATFASRLQSIRKMIFLFVAFIVSCAATHFMDLATLWFPLFWIQCAVLWLCAAPSVATAIYLFTNRRHILALLQKLQKWDC